MKITKINKASSWNLFKIGMINETKKLTLEKWKMKTYNQWKMYLIWTIVKSVRRGEMVVQLCSCAVVNIIACVVDSMMRFFFTIRNVDNLVKPWAMRMSMCVFLFVYSAELNCVGVPYMSSTSSTIFLFFFCFD